MGVYPYHPGQIESIGFPLGPIDGASLLLALSQAMVLLAHFNQLTPAMLLWPLKLIHISLTEAKADRQGIHWPFSAS